MRHGRFLPKLIVDGEFMRDFMMKESPCFALGLVEEREQAVRLFSIATGSSDPARISGLGFNFGYACSGLLSLKSFSSFFTSTVSGLQHVRQSEQSAGKES